MTVHTQMDTRPLSSRRWFLFAASVLTPLILLAVVLLSVSSARADLLAPTATISGLVRNPDGSTITSTAHVCLHHLMDSGGGFNWQSCQDSADGGFSFTETIPSEFLPGEFFVSAYPLGESLYFEAFPLTFHISNNGYITNLGELRWTYASFDGMVYEPGGTVPASEGRVVVHNEAWHPVAEGEYFEGYYRIGAVPDGNFWLKAEAPLDSIFWHSMAEWVTVTEGSQYVATATQPYDLVLQDPNFIAQVVYPDGSPVTWITVTAYEITGWATGEMDAFDQSVHEERDTASWGEFGMRVTPGDYHAWARPSGTLVSTYTKAIPRDVHVFGGSLLPPPTDPFTLTYPSAAGAVLDPDDNPIPDCLNVWLENMQGEQIDNYWYCGGQDTLYMLGGIPAGDYWLGADGLPEFNLFPPETEWVHIAPGDQYDIDATDFITLNLTASQLDVHVTDQLGTATAANVVLWDEWGDEEWAFSEPGNPAQFGGLDDGDYWIQAWPVWQDIPNLANSVEEQVYVDATLISRTLMLNSPDITGTVTTPEGDILPAVHDGDGELVYDPATVHVHSSGAGGGYIRATTNPAGQFSLFLPDGDYDLVAEPKHSLVFSYTKSLVEEFSLTSTTPRPYGLAPIPLVYPRILGIVEDLMGHEIETRVNLWNDAGTYWDEDETFWFNPDTLKPFRFGGLPDGHYYVQAESPDGSSTGAGSSIHEFDVPPSANGEFVVLYMGANVFGEVRFPSGYAKCPGCPVPDVGVWVALDDGSGTHVEWMETGENGTFAFVGMDPDDYVIGIELPPELQAGWKAPPPEFFTLGPPPDQHATTIHLESSNAGLLVTGWVHKPDSSPPPPYSTWIDLCDDEGLCFGSDVMPSGRYTVSVLPGIYEVWVWVDPMTGLTPPMDNGFAVGVYDDLGLDPIWLRAQADRTAHASGRVMLITPTAGLTVGIGGIEVEAWTDTGDWAITETASNGNYAFDLFPGHWHGGPILTPEQEEQYYLLHPRHRDGHLGDGETVTDVNFYLRRRDASIQGQVVEVGQTTPITDVDAVVFAERCVASECEIVAESKVVSGTFTLHVLGGRTYDLGIWLPSGGYMPGPTVSVSVMFNEDKAGVRVEVIKAGTRIYGRLMDADLNWVEIDASVYGYDEDGTWVEDYLHKGDDPYQYNLYVPTPVDDPITWTLGLWADPKTGYIAEPNHPQYTVVVQPGETDVPQIMYVRELDTHISGTVGIMAGGVFTPARHTWVYAEGSIAETAGFYFETQTDADGAFTMTVMPGEYKVSAYLPPHLVGDFFPPQPQPWASSADNPLELLFRHRPPGGELEICGSLSVSPTGSLSDTVSIPVFGWSEDGSFAEVTGTLVSGYCMSVISDTTWYLWAAYEDSDDNAFYHSQERTVYVGSTAPQNVRLDLVRSGHELPETECWSFDPDNFKRLILPAQGNLPEPLVEIQGGTMPVTDTVEVCATPVVAAPGGHRLLGFAYELDAWDSQGNLITQDFDNKVRLIFYLDADTIGNANPADLEMVYYSTVRQEWISLDDVVFSWDDPYWFCTGKIEHFTRIGVMKAESGAEEYQIYLPLVLRSFDG